jgi:hypothetical protein
MTFFLFILLPEVSVSFYIAEPMPLSVSFYDVECGGFTKRG